MMFGITGFLMVVLAGGTTDIIRLHADKERAQQIADTTVLAINIFTMVNINN